MSSIADTAVVIQSSEQSVPSTPSWLGEGTLIAHYLKRLGVLSAIEERVRFARRRFAHYDLIDFVAVFPGFCPSLRTDLRHSAACWEFAPLAIAGASAARSCGRAPLFCKPILTSGWPPLAPRATETIEGHCAAHFR